MPRALGQIDVRKTEAILEAAAEVLAERGLAASIEEVARRAGVSKQTIYNHYGSKADLVRALMERRLALIVAPLDRAGEGDPVATTLTLYAQSILSAVLSPISVQMNRMGVVSAVDMPEMASAIYDAGARIATLRLANYLETRGGQELDISDPLEASEVFAAMVIGRSQYRLMLGLPPGFEPGEIPERASRCAARFMRAYAANS
jgi:TetR/AcrR family transcriptional repressor of mexJK operon